MAYAQKSLNKDWIQSEGSLKSEAITWAEEFGEFLSKDRGRIQINNALRNVEERKLSTNQLRKFFDQLKKLKAISNSSGDYYDQLLMLQAQLAYAVGREKRKRGRDMVDTNKIKYFYEEVSIGIKAIDEIDTELRQKGLKKFVHLIEAVVAYHRYSGGE